MHKITLKNSTLSNWAPVEPPHHDKVAEQYGCIYIHIYINMDERLYRYVCLCACTYACIYMYVCMYVYTHIHTYIYLIISFSYEKNHRSYFLV